MSWSYMPVMNDREITVLPFAMFKPHAKQAMENHGQSLDALKRRGGLSLCEAVAILEDRPWSQMQPGTPRARIRELCRERT